MVANAKRIPRSGSEDTRVLFSCMKILYFRIISLIDYWAIFNKRGLTVCDKDEKKHVEKQ